MTDFTNNKLNSCKKFWKKGMERNQNQPHMMEEFGICLIMVFITHGTLTKLELYLTIQLIGVLTRSRQEEVAVMADIEKMYFQILVTDEHRSLLRFLWWNGGDMSKEIIDHEMCVHVFRGVSSGACSNYALRRTAIEKENKYGKDAAETLKNNFYVDDMLKSVENEDKAIRLMKDVKSMCQEGDFNLKKFAGDSKRVLQSIPEKDRKMGVKNSDLLGSLPEKRALGVLWNVENDTLGFKVNLKQKLLTRRGALSVFSSIYDPVGFGAPFLLKEKQIIRKLCQLNLKWDEDISDEISNEWLR